MFCCTLLYVHSSFAIILMGKRELVALLGLSSWCLVIVVWLFLAVPWVRLRFVIVVFPDHTHLLFFKWVLLFLLYFLLCSFFAFKMSFYLRDKNTETFPRTLRSHYQREHLNFEVLTKKVSLFS